jgi:hypothetical protein
MTGNYRRSSRGYFDAEAMIVAENPLLDNSFSPDSARETPFHAKI